MSHIMGKIFLKLLSLAVQTLSYLHTDIEQHLNGSHPVTPQNPVSIKLWKFNLTKNRQAPGDCITSAKLQAKSSILYTRVILSGFWKTYIWLPKGF